MVSSKSSQDPALTSNAQSKSRPKIFEPIWKDGECTMVLNESISKGERTKLEFDLPECLHEKRLLTQEEIQASGYIENIADTMYWLKVPSGRVPGVIRLSTAFLKRHGFLDRLITLRELSLRPSYVEHLFGIRRTQKRKKTGARFHPGLIFLAHPGYNCLRMSTLVDEDTNGENNTCIMEFTDIISQVTKLVVPHEYTQRQQERAFQDASLIIGPPDNYAYSNIQLNYTKQGSKLKDGLGVRGGVHRDIKNDPTSMTAIVPLSNLAEEYFGGRLNITSLNMTIPVNNFEIILFPGRLYHCSTGIGPYSVPVGHPLRNPPLDPTSIPPLPPNSELLRFVAVVYPNNHMMHPTPRMVNADIFGPKGTRLFADKAQHYDWMLRFFILHEKEIRARLGGKRMQSGSGNGPRLLARAFSHCRAFENYNIIEAVAARAKPKHHLPEYYRQIFEFKNEAGEYIRPSLETVGRMIGTLGKKNTNLEILQNDMKWIEGAGNKGSRKRSSQTSEDASEIDEDPNDWDPASFKPYLEQLAVLSTDPSNREKFDATFDSVINAATTLYPVPSHKKKRGRSSAEIISKGYLPPLKRAELDYDKAAAEARARMFLAGARDIGTLSSESTTEAQVQWTPKRNVPLKRAVRAPTNSDSDLEPDEIVSSESDQETPTSNSRGDKQSSRIRKDPCSGPEVTPDEEEEWEVERLVARRRTKTGKLIYQVRWKGWGQEWDGWKTIPQLKYAQELVEEYEANLAKWKNRARCDY